MSDPEWGARLTAGIGERIAQLRSERKLSLSKLASRCADLGFPSVSRTVLPKLEHGTREHVSVAELLVLAAALDVAPFALLFPDELMVEALPGRMRPHSAVEQWFAKGFDGPAREAVRWEVEKLVKQVAWLQEVVGRSPVFTHEEHGKYAVVS